MHDFTLLPFKGRDDKKYALSTAFVRVITSEFTILSLQIS